MRRALLRGLFDRKFALLVLDKLQDLILPETPELRPGAPCINWRVRHFIVTLRRGCLRLSATESLHRFNPDPPEEFEQESERGNRAESLGATVQFIVNDGNGENEETDSTMLAGQEHSNAVPFPSSLLLLGDTNQD